MSTVDSVMSAALRSRMRNLSATTGENQYHCVMEFDPAFTGFEGHFEGNPIVPGVCLIETARVVAEELTKHQLRTVKIAQSRFRRPIFAGESADATLKLSAGSTPETWKIQAEFRVGEAVSAQMRLEAEIL